MKKNYKIIDKIFGIVIFILYVCFMEYTIEEIGVNGYAFIDETGRCFIIVYGESKRDFIKKYLDE